MIWIQTPVHVHGLLALLVRHFHQIEHLLREAIYSSGYFLLADSHFQALILVEVQFFIIFESFLVFFDCICPVFVYLISTLLFYQFPYPLFCSYAFLNNFEFRAVKIFICWHFLAGHELRSLTIRQAVSRPADHIFEIQIKLIWNPKLLELRLISDQTAFDAIVWVHLIKFELAM